MGIFVQHVLRNAKTGRLSFRRAYPPELRPFLGGAREHKISLKTKDITTPGAMARYEAALAGYDSAVANARKIAAGTYDSLDAPMIAYLGKAFEIEWLEKDEESRWHGADDWADRSRAGWEYKLSDFLEWRGSGDLDAIEEEWSRAAHKLLASRCLVIDPRAGDALRNLCRELNDAAIRVSDVALARLGGAIVATPPPPPPFAPRGQAVAPKVPLLATFDDYATAALKPLTAQDWRRCIVHLVAFLGHDDAGKLTTDDLMRWRNQLLTEPSRKGGLRQAVTVRGKYLGSVKAMLNWAVEEHKLKSNVALAVTVRAKKKPKLRDRDFTDEEANRILSATFAPASPNMAPGYALARRWVPWLCAYSGARVNELSQLRAEDVVEVAGVWTIRITPEAGTVKGQAARVVPLHPHLIEQGFLDAVRVNGAGPLFYDPDRQRVQSATNRHVKKVGEKLAAWVRKDVGLSDPNLQPNHGWRHRFKTVARSIKMDPEVRDAIQGHASNSVAQDYGSVPIATMAEAIARLPRYVIGGD